MVNYVHLYIASHLPINLPSNEIVSPVGAGEVGAQSDLYRLKDSDTKNNISHLNVMYCELTVQYMVLSMDKSLIPEKIGFMHYRRFLSFANPLLTTLVNPMLRFIEGNSLYLKLFDFHLQPTSIRRIARKADLLIPYPLDLRTGGFSSVREHYVQAPSHFESDWEACGAVIKEIYPELAHEWDHLSVSPHIYVGNIYVMSKSLFFEYGTKLFQILEQVRMRIDFEHRSTQEKRVLGYLAERIFTAFVGLKRREKTILIRHLSLVHADPTPHR
jgi:hypothetical protein